MRPGPKPRTRPAGRPRRILRASLRLALAILLLPTALILLYRLVDPPLTPLMLIRLAQGHGLAHDSVALADIAPSLRQAVIAAEDNRFCRHAGFDVPALRAELQEWLEGGRPRGASTITMQTAKNLLLWPGRDIVRKLAEAWLTPQLELLWPKQRILEVYLNVVEFGPGIYGAEAAAQAFFAKPARHLTRREAARLAAVLPNPLAWSAQAPGAYVRGRATIIERRMAQLGPLLDCASAS
jgi:monofunctional biosynthetic peptidoglycan transglycosylase